MIPRENKNLLLAAAVLFSGTGVFAQEEKPLGKPGSFLGFTWQDYCVGTEAWTRWTYPWGGTENKRNPNGDPACQVQCVQNKSSARAGETPGPKKCEEPDGRGNAAEATLSGPPSGSIPPGGSVPPSGSIPPGGAPLGNSRGSENSPPTRQADSFGSTAYVKTVPVRPFGVPLRYPESAVTPPPRCNSRVQPTAFWILSGTNRLARVNSCTGALVADIPVPANSTQVVVTPNGKWAIVTSFDQAISFIDTDTNRLVRTVRTAATANPSGIAVSRDSSYALVTNIGIGPSLFVVDVAAQTVAATIPVDRSFPQSVVLSPDGTLAWVTFPRDNVVEAIDVLTWEISRTIPVPEPRDIVFNRTGTVAYIASGSASGSVVAIDTKTYAVIKTIPAGAGANELLLNDNGILTVNNFFGNSTTVIDTATLTGTTTPAGGRPMGVITVPVE
jgi:YVTN family beta-propeller protein